jgi:restriction system protein
MIDIDEPADWRAFQEWVSQILSECGVTTEVEKEVDTARGVVVVDVWAHDHSATPPQTYLVECKQWRSRVTKTIVHAFRTVVGDSGANWGAIVSAKGFQKGAYDAAQYSNVRPLTWFEFQELFETRWFERHFLPTIAKNTYPLIEYTEPINSRIFRKADALSPERQDQFRRLREEYFSISTLILLYGVPAVGPLEHIDRLPRLPLRPYLAIRLKESGLRLPDNILDAPSLRSLLAAILTEAREAIVKFDMVFDGRA